MGVWQLLNPTPESLYPTIARQVIKLEVTAKLPDNPFIQLIAKVFGIKTLRIRGSGVLLQDAGRVVTANHVVSIKGITTLIGVSTNGKRFGCKVLAQDADRDLALLACDGLIGVSGVRNLASLTLPVGRRIIAAGCASGGPLIISDGIVAQHYSDTDKGKLLCSVMGGPGMSGGGVFTYDGELVGIIQAGYNKPPFTMITTSNLQLRRFLKEHRI